MLTKLLTIKHWQLFLMIFVIPTLCQICAFSMIFSAQNVNDELSKSLFNAILVSILSASLISHMIYMMWIWAIATKIHRKLPVYLHLDLVKFKLTAIITIILFCLLLSFMAMLFATIFGYPLYDDIFNIIPVIFVVEWLMLFSIIYVFYFTGKTIALAEMKTEVGLNSYIGNSLLLGLFPIGVWILQPKLNKLIQSPDLGL